MTDIDVVNHGFTDYVDEETVESRSHTKIDRAEQLSALRERDGDVCQFPACGLPLDFEIPEGPLQVTIDHWMPQHYGKDNGWTYDQIWDLSNLKLMHKRCNAKKGERIPNEDGTLPERVTRTFRYRRDKRATRPDLCMECDNGHNLLIGEVCAACGTDAQQFPRWAKMRAPECDHAVSWCWACSIGWIERPSSIGIAMRQADSTELGEMLDSNE